MSGAPRSPRSIRLAVAVAAALLLGAGVATAAGRLFEEAAPSAVKSDIANVDQGIPPDLRYNPDTKDAHLVAEADGARMYQATLSDGGYCTEIETDTGVAGAVCTSSEQASVLPIEVVVPWIDPITVRSPIIVGGRVNAGPADTLEARFSDGTTQDVPFGDDGFFVFSVDLVHLKEAHLHGFKVVASDSSGAQIATAEVPPDDFSDPETLDRQQPIFVSTISTQADFTKVLGVEGSVNIDGAETLELVYPDGTTVDVPLTENGHYRYDLPVKRQDDLFQQPGWLIARDASGDELARAAVASVASYRAR